MLEDEGWGRLVHMRNYEQLSHEVDASIKQNGWSSVVQELRELRNRLSTWKSNVDLSSKKRKWVIPDEMYHENPTWITRSDIKWGIHSGTFRDAFAHILGIPRGLDVNHLELAEELEVNSLANLRSEMWNRGLESLDTQIAKRNTFFLEILTSTESDLLTHGYVGKIPSIIEARVAEIESLPKKPRFRDVVRTYYGFNLLVLGSLHHTGFGTTKKTQNTIAEFLDEIAELKRPDETSLKFDPSYFDHCSSSTASLLVHILEMGIGAIETQLRGKQQLEALGDSRAIPYLISDLESEKNDAAQRSRLDKVPSNRLLREKTLDVIGAIGNPEAFETVAKIFEAEKSTESVRTMAGIKHSKTKEFLLRVINQEETKLVKIALGCLWRLRDPTVLGVLRDNLRKKPKDYGYDVLRSLILMGKKGHQTIFEESEYIAKAIRTKAAFLKLFEILELFPQLLKDEQIVETITNHITNPSNFIVVYDAIVNIDSLVTNPRIHEALIEILRKDPAGVLYRLSHLVKEGNEFSKALKEGTDNLLNYMFSSESRHYDVYFGWCMKYDVLYEQAKVRNALIQILLKQVGVPYNFTRANTNLLAILMKRAETATDPRLRPLIIQCLTEGKTKIFMSLNFRELLDDEKIRDVRKQFVGKD